jgi:hypothetical protein
MRKIPLGASDFPNRIPVLRCEGGAVYTAERAGKFYVIRDESAMAGLLSADDAADLDFETVLEFDTSAERATYMHEHGMQIGQPAPPQENATADTVQGLFARAGSQRWLQVAVNRKPDLLLSALRRCGAVGPRASLRWHSPLEAEGFREYRDLPALERAGVQNLKVPLASFWPPRGPVWDAIATTSDGKPLFVEAKAHIPEAASPASRASAASLELIERSLCEARRHYAPRASAGWTSVFYQYANRRAHQYFLRQVNGLPSVLVFLYFVNADDMLGPMSEEEWHGAARLIHAVLGLPKDLQAHGVFDAFLDVRLLQDAI